MKFEDIFENQLNIGETLPAVSKLLSYYETFKVPLHSLLIIRDDVLIAEKYFGSSCGIPNSKYHLHRMYSLTKSLTSTAVGFLIEDGLVSLDDSIMDYYELLVPSSSDGSNTSDRPNASSRATYLNPMTIKDLLTMRTCHTKTTYKLDFTKDWVNSFFVTVPTKLPGGDFCYDTSASHVLASLVEKLTRVDMLDYLKTKLCPLEFSKESYIIKDPFGVSVGGSGLMATTRDLAVWAFFVEHHGIINGSPLLNPDYIIQATSRQTVTVPNVEYSFEHNGYGFFFWCGEGNDYFAYGKDGQFVFFSPDSKLIMISTADTSANKSLNQTIYDGFTKFKADL